MSHQGWFLIAASKGSKAVTASLTANKSVKLKL